MTLLFKKEIKQQEFSLLGALYLDKIVRKFKNFVQFLNDKPINNASLQELNEIAQIMSCENLEEAENYLNEKTELLLNKTLKVDDIRDLLSQRVDMNKDMVAMLMKNYI